MNKSFLSTILVFFFFSKIISAQGLEIYLFNKLSKPMPYGYILINGKPISISDSSGKAIIPINKIMNNDTISISYLGASTASFIFNDSLKKEGKCSVYLEEPNLVLDEAIVTYQDFEKLYKKSVVSFPEIMYNCIMNADFNARFRYSDNKYYQSSGTFEAKNELWSRKFTPRFYGYFHHPIKFNSKDDTARIGPSLRLNMHFILNLVNKALAISREKPLLLHTPNYCYLGEKDQQKIFRLSYPNNDYINYPCQIMIYVNSLTKYIETIKVESVNIDQNIGYFTKFSLTFNCSPYTSKGPRMDTIYLPDDIHFKSITIYGTEVELNLSYIQIKPIHWIYK